MKKRYLPTWDSIREHRVPDWYQDCKLGIFIHWGLYSVPAYATPTFELGTASDEEWFTNNPYAEWYYNSLKMGRGPTFDYHAEKYGKDFPYENFTDLWKAENFAPGQWAKLFKAAGAQYVVMVTKHHDGFCLFPSQFTEYHAGNLGPNMDLVGSLTEAVRREGLKMGLYYSGIIDWRFADEPIYTDKQVTLNCSPTYEYADYAYKQAMELIDRYRPSVFWNDIGWPFAGVDQLPYLLSHYYNTCEDGVVNDRFNGLWKDYSTKEYQYGSVTREEKWEMCRGLGLSFGYNAAEGEEHTLTVEKLVSLLVSTVANNGNLLINIGPKADGAIPGIQADRLAGLGKWISVNGEAIYNTRCSRRLSIETEHYDLHFTKKTAGSGESPREDLFIMIDNLAEGQTTVFVSGLEVPPQPLDQNVTAEVIQKGNGFEIIVDSHSASNGAVVFKSPGGE